MGRVHFFGGTPWSQAAGRHSRCAALLRVNIALLSLVIVFGSGHSQREAQKVGNRSWRDSEILRTPQQLKCS